MLVAIPLQGFAGVSAAVCAGHHQTLYGAEVSVATDAQQLAHTHMSHAVESGNHAALHENHASPDTSDAGTPALEHKPQQKCGGCGPCCVGAVLSSSVQPTIAALDGKTDFPSLASCHVSPAVRGLDRPPQTVRA